MKLLFCATLLTLSLDCSSAFQVQSKANRDRLTWSSTALYEAKHKFNGGYDASEVESIAKWTPKEAAEFVIWHMSDKYEDVGRQLTPMIKDWNGKNLGEFLSRVYLGKTTDDFEIAFESKYVRSPQWKGLDTEEGLLALKELLRTALPDSILEEPVQMANVAEVFLWQERTCPAANLETKELEQASFASLGYTPAIVHIWMELREERGGQRNFVYSSEDVLEMVPAPSKDWGALQLQGIQQFFFHMGIRLAPSCKIELVQGMASGGWNPGKIAKLVSSIPETGEEEKIARVPELKKEEASSVDDKKKIKPKAFPAPLEKSHLDNVSLYTKFLKEKREKTESSRKSKDGKIVLPTPTKVPSLVEEYLGDSVPKLKNDALDAVRKKILKAKKEAPWQ